MKALCRASFEEANTQHLDRIIGVLVGTTSTREEYHRAGMDLLATLHTDAALAYEPAPAYEAPSSATEVLETPQVAAAVALLVVVAKCRHPLFSQHPPSTTSSLQSAPKQVQQLVHDAGRCL
jgi:hypothetical protein